MAEQLQLNLQLTHEDRQNHLPILLHYTGNTEARRRRIQIKQYHIEYILERTQRRSIGLVIDHEGLRIRAPNWVPIVQIEAAIDEKHQWIYRQWMRCREKINQPKQAPINWQEGAIIHYLGHTVQIHLAHNLSTNTYYDTTQKQLHIALPHGAHTQQLKDAVHAWLQKEAWRIFSERLNFYAEKLQVRFKRFCLSSTTSRWGSCDSKGTIRLSWYLICFSLEIIDYVVVHELSHLREMNHSPRFWQTVQSVLPEFKEVRKQLRLQSAVTHLLHQ